MGIGLHQGRFYGFVIHQIMKVAHNNIYIFHITSCIKTKNNKCMKIKSKENGNGKHLIVVINVDCTYGISSNRLIAVFLNCC